MTKLDKAELARWSTAPLRLFLGLSFLAHGAQKVFGAFGGRGVGAFSHNLRFLGFPMPELMGWFVALLELIGGVLLVAGLGTRVVAALLGLEMIVAAVAVHLPHGFFAQGGGMEVPLAYLAGLISLVMTGGGELSADEELAKVGRPHLFGAGARWRRSHA